MRGSFTALFQNYNTPTQVQKGHPLLVLSLILFNHLCLQTILWLLLNLGDYSEALRICTRGPNDANGTLKKKSLHLAYLIGV